MWFVVLLWCICSSTAVCGTLSRQLSSQRHVWSTGWSKSARRTVSSPPLPLSLPSLPLPLSPPPSLFPFLNCAQPLWWRWCSWSMLAISRVWASPEAWGITVERRGRKGQSCLSFISLEATRRNCNNPHQTLESLLHSSNYGVIPL